MILTVLLISTPPMAAMFFNGTLAAGFSAYSQFGVTQGRPVDKQGQPVQGAFRPEVATPQIREAANVAERNVGVHR